MTITNPNIRQPENTHTSHIYGGYNSCPILTVWVRMTITVDGPYNPNNKLMQCSARGRGLKTEWDRTDYTDFTDDYSNIKVIALTSSHHLMGDTYVEHGVNRSI